MEAREQASLLGAPESYLVERVGKNHETTLAIAVALEALCPFAVLTLSSFF